jgi:hypothetical protein
MQQPLPRQIIVHKTNHSAHPLNSKPQQQILSTVPPIDRHHFPLLHTQIINQPIRYAVQRIEEFAIRPFSAFEDQEHVVWLRFGMVFKNMVGERFVLSEARGEPVEVGLRGGETTAAGCEVVCDVVFGVEIEGQGRCAGGAGGEDGYCGC